MRPATVVVAAGRPTAVPDAPLNAPVHFASALAAGGPVGYAREDQQNSAALEQALGRLEGGEAVVFASGMAAISAVLDVCAPGSVAAPPVAYSGSRAVLRSRVDRTGLRLEHPRDAHAWRLAGQQCDLLWLESPTNPDLQIIDLAAVCVGAAAVTVVDNTFATPLAQRPLELGADIVVHSVSKFLSGHSDLILGAVVTKDPGMAARFRRHRGLYGAIPGPMESWLALRGLRTLDVRLRRASDNAAILADRLSRHPDVAETIWPGLPDHPGHEVAERQMALQCPVICFRPRGGPDAAEAVCTRTALWRHATSLGGVESTLERRRKWPMESDLVPADLIRLSVGIEDVEDLWEDLVTALEGR